MTPPESADEILAEMRQRKGANWHVTADYADRLAAALKAEREATERLRRRPRVAHDYGPAASALLGEIVLRGRAPSLSDADLDALKRVLDELAEWNTFPPQRCAHRRAHRADREIGGRVKRADILIDWSPEGSTTGMDCSAGWLYRLIVSMREGLTGRSPVGAANGVAAQRKKKKRPGPGMGYCVGARLVGSPEHAKHDEWGKR